MIDENIDYLTVLPIKIFIDSIDEYPIHNHNALEIIHVLEGELEFKASIYNCTLTQGDIYIVNSGDLHRFCKKSDSNLLLFLQIDLEYFQKYLTDVNKIIFICDSYNNKNKSETKKIKQYLEKIMLETLDKKEGYEERTEILVLNILQDLINTYQYVYVEGNKITNISKYKDNKIQIERIQRINDYIYDHYDKKITLDQIAETEHISKYYLTHLLKDGTGYGFQEILNLIRIERSEILLFNSKKSIEEISYECGFSSSRYFKQYFIKYFGITPGQYRKEYVKNSIEVKPIIRLIEDESELTKRFKTLLNITREGEGKGLDSLNTIELDFAVKKGIKFYQCWKSLNLSDVNQGLTLHYQKNLQEIQEILEFNYISISFHSCYYNYNVIGSWDWISQFLSVLNRIGIIPKILISFNQISYEELEGKFSQVLSGFLYFYKCEYGIEKLKNIIVKVQGDMKSKSYCTFIHVINSCCKPYNINVTESESILNDLTDGRNYTKIISLIISHTIENIDAKSQNDIHIVLEDECKKFLNSQNHFCSGGGLSLMDLNGLRKPAYYAFSILSKLGNEIVANGDGYIITKRKKDFNLLMINYSDSIKNFNLKLTGINKKYIVKKYKLDQESGYEVMHWADMGCPEKISEENVQLIKTVSSPKVNFSYVDEKNLCDEWFTLKPFEVNLIIFEETAPSVVAVVK